MTLFLGNNENNDLMVNSFKNRNYHKMWVIHTPGRPWTKETWQKINYWERHRKWEIWEGSKIHLPQNSTPNRSKPCYIATRNSVLVELVVKKAAMTVENGFFRRIVFCCETKRHSWIFKISAQTRGLVYSGPKTPDRSHLANAIKIRREKVNFVHFAGAYTAKIAWAMHNTQKDRPAEVQKPMTHERTSQDNVGFFLSFQRQKNLPRPHANSSIADIIHNIWTTSGWAQTNRSENRKQAMTH